MDKQSSKERRNIIICSGVRFIPAIRKLFKNIDNSLKKPYKFFLWETLIIYITIPIIEYLFERNNNKNFNVS